MLVSVKPETDLVNDHYRYNNNNNYDYYYYR